MIYLDNAATTKIDPEVLDAMMPYLMEEYGNPGGQYSLGKRARDAIDHAREQVAWMLNTEPDSIVFTSGGSEANNLALKSFLTLEKHKRGIITDRTEHDSVLNVLPGVKNVSYVPVNQYGSVEISSIYDKITPETGLISMMYVNNESGAINPVVKVGEVCKEKGIIFFTDCVQAAGGHKLDVERFQCDFLSISSHKIHGPKGVGALYTRSQLFCSPLINGGKYQESGLRGGTENVAGIVGFGKACEIVARDLDRNVEFINLLHDRFLKALFDELTKLGIKDCMHLNSDPAVTGKTLNIRFDDVDATTLILMLDLHGVCVSGGSACTSLENKPSHVLLAMGISPEDARHSIRISFSRMNTEEEVVKAAETIATCVKMLQK